MKLRSRGPSSFSPLSFSNGSNNGISHRNVQGRTGRKYLSPFHKNSRRSSVSNSSSYFLSRRNVLSFFVGVTIFQIYGSIYFYQSSHGTSQLHNTEIDQDGNHGNGSGQGIGIFRTLSSLWNSFLQGPLPETDNVKTLRNKGYSQVNEEDYPPRQPDTNPEANRSRKQRRITRSSRQRLEVKEMKNKFQQLQDNGKLLPCRWEPSQQQNQEKNTEQGKAPLLLCLPWSPLDPSSAKGNMVGGGGWQQSLFRSVIGSQRRQKRDKILLRNTFPHDRIITCRQRGGAEERSSTTVVIPANGGIVELEGEQVQNCYNNGRHQLFRHTPIPITNTADFEASGSHKLLQNRGQIPPIVVSFNGEDPDDAHPFTEGNCTIPCLVAGSFELLSVIGIADTNWEIIQR